MDNPASHQRKHDLVEVPAHTPLDNDTDQPHTKRKRTLSLKRPSSFSPAPSAAISTSSSPTHSTEHTTATTAATEDDNADTTASLLSHSPVPQQDNSATWHSERRSTLAIPDSNGQKGRSLQKNKSSTTTIAITTTTTATTTTATAATAESIVQLQCLASEEEKDLDDFETPVLPAATFTKAFRNSKTPPTTDELFVQGSRSSSAVVDENEKDDDESIVDATNLPGDLMHDPDCDETPILDDFELDEIQDWDDFEDIPTPIDPVPENTCPVCGVNLSSLDTMPNGRKAGGNFKPKPSRPCPFYKKMPDTGFTVDAFCYGKVEGCDAYFLSHFHSDHYGGLTSTWDHGPIYCSSITANLVIKRLRVDEQYVKRLPMYEPTVIGGVTVRLMDANHCPGSVLFVFDLHNPKRRYLHTGDFRATPDMITDPILRQPQNVPIDILYLDTTYSNPRYTFPPQDVVIQETARLICKEVGVQADLLPAVAAAAAPVVKTTRRVNLMESWLKKESGNSEKLLSMSVKSSQITKSKQAWKEPAEKNKIVICVGTYLIGKERVFKAIAKAINSKVYVQSQKLQIMQCLEDPELMDMLTNDRHEAQVHLLHMGSDMSPEALQDYLDSLAPTFVRLIAIRPTGWTFTGTKKFTPANDNGPMDASTSSPKPPTSLEFRPSFMSATVKIYPVPYSEHSSFSELAGFVRSLSIHKVIPTVGVGSEKGRHAMNEWFKRWEQERRQGIGWD
ncbi:DNA break repair nuclease [Linnemannia zychae]|nr:DNA break repair nuclease [Linnemannia zychae]